MTPSDVSSKLTIIQSDQIPENRESEYSFSGVNELWVSTGTSRLERYEQSMRPDWPSGHMLRIGDGHHCWRSDDPACTTVIDKGATIPFVHAQETSPGRWTAKKGVFVNTGDKTSFRLSHHPDGTVVLKDRSGETVLEHLVSRQVYGYSKERIALFCRSDPGWVNEMNSHLGGSPIVDDYDVE